MQYRTIVYRLFVVGILFLGNQILAQSPIDPATLLAMGNEAIEKGNPARGAVLFAAPTSACISCHKVGPHGGSVGPDLSKTGAERKIQHIVESLLAPKAVVEKEYQAIAVLGSDGAVVRGYRVRETDDVLELRDSATGEIKSLPQDDIEAVQNIGTLMPDGLLATFSKQDKLDLISFVAEQGKHEKLSAKATESLLSHSHGHHVAEFEYTREPLEPERWPSWQAHVNRDRVYDYYRKQARYFRGMNPRPTLLPEFPGLDGGALGHWGNQSEPTWENSDWNKSDLGSLLSGIFRSGKLKVARGICIRLGEGKQQISACFDPDNLSYPRVWSGGFVRFTSVRHGLMQGLNQDGTTIEVQQTKLPFALKKTSKKRYLGFYRNGRRVIFAYEIDGIEYLDAPTLKDGEFRRVVAPRKEHPDRKLCAGGSAQWPQEFITSGTIGTTTPYACDKIGLPVDNPWKALIYGSGLGFLSDGTAIYCTMQGDVWRVRGLDDRLSKVNWRRIATGLNQPLGAVVHDDQIFVIGRDQLTRLHDKNDDGEIDFYECFSQAIETSSGGHDFTCGLERDEEGHFYTATGKSGVMRISASGRRAEMIASGLRNSDGIGLHPDGLVTIPSSEGDWTPASMIAAVRPGQILNRVQGRTPDDRGLPFFGRPGTNLNNPPEVPMVYLPRGLDNSSGGQVHVSSDKWGPTYDQMVHLSFGTGTAFLLLRDEFDEWVQGAVVPLGVEFASGAHRGKFNPVDGQLYVSGMTGWGTYTPETGCFHRVRYNAKAAQLPTGFHVHKNGIRINFARPVDAGIASDPKQHFAQCWNYRYSGAYGSPEFSAQRLGLRGHDVLEVTAVHLLDEGRGLFLQIPQIQPVNQLHLLVQTSADQSHDLFMTVNRMDDDFTDFDGYESGQKAVLPHPMLADFYRPRAMVRNPNRKAIAGSRPVDIKAAKNLMFDKTEIRVKPGEAIQLTFHNPDAVPHNWALVKPGKLKEIGLMCNKLIAEPEAMARHYVPKTDDVLVYTDIVEPNGKFTIQFRAPEQPGRYPYLCTFPGHWMVMNGHMIVEP